MSNMATDDSDRRGIGEPGCNHYADDDLCYISETG
jgi:hypothetical protein